MSKRVDRRECGLCGAELEHEGIEVEDENEQRFLVCEGCWWEIEHGLVRERLVVLSRVIF